MRIAVSSTGPDPGDLMDPRFGRCRFFVFYNTETGAYTSKENTARLH